jgi:hypothetical protein
MAGGNTHKHRSTIQSEKLLALLRSAHNAWIPLPEILALGIAQYNARIWECRKRGLLIENRTETIDGVRRSWFRLVDSPAPALASTHAWADRPRLTGLPLFDLGVKP